MSFRVVSQGVPFFTEPVEVAEGLTLVKVRIAELVWAWAGVAE